MLSIISQILTLFYGTSTCMAFTHDIAAVADKKGATEIGSFNVHLATTNISEVIEKLANQSERVTVVVLAGPIYSTHQTVNYGPNYNYGNNSSLSLSTGASYGPQIGPSYGVTYGTSFGESYGMTLGNSYGNSYGPSFGNSIGPSFGVTFGASVGPAYGATYGASYGASYGPSYNIPPPPGSVPPVTTEQKTETKVETSKSSFTDKSPGPSHARQRRSMEEPTPFAFVPRGYADVAQYFPPTLRTWNNINYQLQQPTVIMVPVQIF